MIDGLSPQAYCQLMAMLRPEDDDDWDRQMADDAKAGRLDVLIEEAEQAAKRGEVRDFHA